MFVVNHWWSYLNNVSTISCIKIVAYLYIAIIMVHATDFMFLYKECVRIHSSSTFECHLDLINACWLGPASLHTDQSSHE